MCSLTQYSVTFPDLGTLAAEEWVVDRVIDHTLGKAQTEFPAWWHAETSFFQWLMVADDFSSARVRKRRDDYIARAFENTSGAPLLAGVLNPSGAHWTAIGIDVLHGTIYYGHSGPTTQAPPAAVVDKLAKYFEGSRVAPLTIKTALILPVPQQGRAYGSCGLAAAMSLIRWVSFWFNSPHPALQWQGVNSLRHRREWFSSILRDALHRHATANSGPISAPEEQVRPEPDDGNEVMVSDHEATLQAAQSLFFHQY